MTTDSRHRLDPPVIGIDVGGTKCLAVVHLGGTDVVRVERPTPFGSKSLIDTIAELSAEVETIAARLGVMQATTWDVGVGLPGLVTRSGILRAAPNLVDVIELDAKHVLEDRLARRVWVDNDATCAAVAEWREGAGVDCENFLLVTIGTGIGAGIIANGQLLRGTNGFAGELGHMFVDPAGPECPCGRSGCWERYASGSGLALLARRAVENGSGDDFVQQAGSIENIRGNDVADLASRGSLQALAVLDEFGRWIAVGLSNMVNVLDPERIVLGGGVARMGELLVHPVRSWLERLLYASDHRPTPDVVIAHFGESAGAIGAGMLPLVH